MPLVSVQLISLDGLTSSNLLCRGGSSGFFSIFCLRLSLLAGRAGLSASTSLEADRLAVGVLPRTGALEPEAMLAGWGELEVVAACEDVMDDDEFLGRAVAGGVGEARMCESMAGRSDSAAPLQLGEKRQSCCCCCCSHGNASEPEFR